MSEVDQKEKLFVFVYLNTHTIFPSVAEANGRHIIPQRILLCLEDGMGWFSEIFGSFDARIAQFQFLFGQSMVFRVMLYEMVNALGLNFHHAVVEVFLAVSSVPAVLDFQRTLVLYGFNFLRLEFQSMWLEGGEAVA